MFMLYFSWGTFHISPSGPLVFFFLKWLCLWGVSVCYPFCSFSSNFDHLFSLLMTLFFRNILSMLVTEWWFCGTVTPSKLARIFFFYKEKFFFHKIWLLWKEIIRHWKINSPFLSYITSSDYWITALTIWNKEDFWYLDCLILNI